MTQTLIFDFDGTIADSFETFLGIFRELTGFDGQKLSQKDLEFLRSLPARQVAKELGIPLWRVPILVTKGRKMLSARLDQIPIFEDMVSVLGTLKSRGYDLQVMSTNSPQNVEKFLERHDLRRCFSQIHGNVGLFSKARKLQKIVRAQHLRLQDCWYIGDEARDVEAAKKARMKHVAVTWGFNTPGLLKKLQPYALASMPKDLLRIFE